MFYFGVCKTFVAAASTVSTKNLNSRELKARNSLHLSLPPKIFAFESIAPPLMICHGNFGPAEKLVRGTKISGILVRADHFFLKILVPP